MATEPSGTIESFAGFVGRELGLHFRKERLPELARKMSALGREEGFEALEYYLLQLMSAPLSRERVRTLAGALTIGETYFLRDPKSYRALEEKILPGLIAARRRGDKTIKIWSAGCSTGEEPYSIAIVLSRLIHDLAQWKISILATDLNEQALERARLGVYGKWSFRNAPGWLMGYFTPTPDGNFEIVPRIREMVQFGRLNLADDKERRAPLNGGIDIIFCRNVMLYFHEAQIRKTVTRFHAALKPGGWLFVGPTEVEHQRLAGFVCHHFDGAMALQKGEPRQKPQRRQVSGAVPASPPPPGLGTLRLRTGAVRADAPKRQELRIWDAGHADPPPAFAAPMVAPPADETADPIEAADALFRAGDYEKAAEAALVAAPQAEHLFLAARCFANLGRYTEAQELCERAVRADRLNPRTHYLLSMILEQRGDFEGAVRSLKHALYLDHDFLLAYFALGNLFRKLGDQAEAERSFATALHLLQRIDPDEPISEAEGITAGALTQLIKAISRS